MTNDSIQPRILIACVSAVGGWNNVYCVVEAHFQNLELMLIFSDE